MKDERHLLQDYGDSARYWLSAVFDSTAFVAGCLLSQIFFSQRRNVFGFFLPTPLAAAAGINLTFFP